MDIAKLDSRTMAETPHFLHWKDPVTGKLMFDGETAIGAMVRGAHARTVQESLRKRQKAELTGGVDKLDQRALEDLQADLVKSASLVTTEIVGLTMGGAKIDADSFPVIYDLNFFDTDVMMGRKTKKPGSFAQQTMAFVNEASNFLTDA